MTEFPHSYAVSASGGPKGTIPTGTPGVPSLDTNAPPEFGGPEGYWSPETMLSASVANCFILTFRAISRKADLDWSSLEVDVDGILDKTPEGLRFTEFRIRAALTTASADDADSAGKLLDKAKQHCLVTASLNARITLEPTVTAQT